MQVKRRQVAAAMVSAMMAIGVISTSSASAGGNDNHDNPCPLPCHPPKDEGPVVVWTPPITVRSNPPADPPKEPPTTDPKPDPEPDPDCIGGKDDDCEKDENGLWNSDGNGDGGYGSGTIGSGPIVLR